MTTQPTYNHDQSKDSWTNLALRHLVQRLKSQPLLLALGALMILATVATASVEALRSLLPAAVTIVIVAMIVWAVIEVIRFRRPPPADQNENVVVDARQVGQTGEVIGVDDQSATSSRSGASVKLKARDITGRVVGIQRGPKRP